MTLGEFNRDGATRRRFLGAAAVGGLGLLAKPAWTETIDLHAKGGPGQRPLTTSYPEKGRVVFNYFLP